MFTLVSSNFIHIDIPQDVPCETCFWAQVIDLSRNSKGLPRQSSIKHEMLSKRQLPFFFESWLSILMWCSRNHKSYFEVVKVFFEIIVSENEVYFLEILVLDVFEYVDEVLHLSLWALPWFHFKATSWTLTSLGKFLDFCKNNRSSISFSRWFFHSSRNNFDGCGL